MNEQKESIQKAANRLHLSAFACYEDYTKPQNSFEENLYALLQEQVQISDQQRISRRIRYAGFPQIKPLTLS
ncbi:MAG: hypothetical protein A2Y21_01595 [Clostridiales bacterium GWC2_40_7]|nr:MAG: hypothetical protein A2Y21_01595 [Clostridiales bacterium GWC2_40_7]